MIEIRSFKQSDLPVLLEFLNELDGEQRLLYMHYGEGDFLSWLHEREIEVLVAEDSGRVVGSVAYNDGFWGEEIEWVIVDRSVDRKLVGDMLVRLAEERVKRGALFTTVSSGSLRINEWLQRGYFMNGGLNYMLSRLDEPRAMPEIPPNIELRSLEHNEEDAFIEVVNAGFGWERVCVGDIEKWKEKSPPFGEEWIHVAEVDGKLVSVVVAKPDIGYNKFLNANRGILGPAATLVEYRGLKLASALTVRAMNFLLEQEMDSVCLFTLETNDASVKLLRKIGFEVGHNWKFLVKFL